MRSLYPFVSHGHVAVCWIDFTPFISYCCFVKNSFQFLDAKMSASSVHQLQKPSDDAFYENLTLGLIKVLSKDEQRKLTHKSPRLRRL